MIDTLNRWWRENNRSAAKIGTILLILFCRPSRSNFLFQLGFLAALAGEALRVWASGHPADGESPYRSGPYAMTRYPKWFGDFLMLAGIGIACTSIRHWFAAALTWGAVFVMHQYYFPLRIEEADAELRERFGESFQRYCVQIPALWPHPELWREARTTSEFDTSRVTRSGELKRIALFLLAALILRFKMTYGI